MARLNKTIPFTEKTHEGAPAARTTVEQQLRRSVLACLLWEDQFYEDGEEIADRIVKLVGKSNAQTVALLALEARSQFNLRHVPLLLIAALAKHKKLEAPMIPRVIQRADELAELLAVHAKLNKVALDKVKKIVPAQMKKGLSAAFAEFDEFQLAKYDREGGIRLRDVAFICHVKPQNKDQARLTARLVNRSFFPEATKGGTKIKKALALSRKKPGLAIPDTWEVQLSTGADKKETFTRLINATLAGGKDGLGYFALLRNLRGMAEAGVDPALIKEAILARKNGAHRILPFRFVAAARAAKQFEPALDESLLATIAAQPRLTGLTAVLVDVSGSMDAKLSGKSDMSRVDAAATLASMINGDCRVFSFSNGVVEVPPRKGMAGVDAIVQSQRHSGTRLFEAVDGVKRLVPKHDRMIVITDEQAHFSGGISSMPAPGCKHAYVINTAAYKNGVGYGPWTHIDGFSEAVLRFIHESEAAD